mmetsp:Transcript_32789/g.78309  ORF Transcript_32789/g.78309 Transcript_32789/m.78309 type:complete len:234 (+) Transcript_32789:26-727(+)
MLSPPFIFPCLLLSRVRPLVRGFALPAFLFRPPSKTYRKPTLRFPGAAKIKRRQTPSEPSRASLQIVGNKKRWRRDGTATTARPTPARPPPTPGPGRHPTPASRRRTHVPVPTAGGGTANGTADISSTAGISGTADSPSSTAGVGTRRSDSTSDWTRARRRSDGRTEAPPGTVPAVRPASTTPGWAAGGRRAAARPSRAQRRSTASGAGWPAVTTAATTLAPRTAWGASGSTP